MLTLLCSAVHVSRNNAEKVTLVIVILTFNRLESNKTNYMDTNPGMFSSKTLISFRLKKEILKHFG